MGTYNSIYVPIFSILKMETQGQPSTPTLYTMYGKQYDFNELSRIADQGLAEHLSTLKRGSKDETQFRDAYRNIMKGIQDGSITYQDGRFVDTKYGYQNSSDKDKNKDHYGLMASYIFNKMGKSPEYVKPEDKTKIRWDGPASIGQALIRELYNSDRENIEAFVDLDREDLNSTKARARNLSTAFTKVLSNFDNLFTGYTDADKTKYTSDTGYINEALKSLSDESFDAGDYLALSRAASGLNYRGMFTRAQATNPDPEAPDSPSQPSQVQLFQQFMDEEHPQHTFTDSGPLFDYNTASKIQLAPEIQTAFNQVLSGMSDEQLQDTLRRYIRTPKESAPFQVKLGNTTTPISNATATALMLKYLKDNNKLSTYNFGESSYYLPGSWKKGGASGLVWDTATGKVSEADYLTIPYLRQQMLQEFNTWAQNRLKGNSTMHWLDSYGLYKKGGVIKAQHGIKFTDKANWHTGVYQAQLNTILEKLKSDPEYYKWLNNMQDKHYNIYRAAGGDSNTWLDQAYRSNDVQAYQDLYKSGNNNEFAEGSGGYNQYGINNSYNLGMFDRFGPYTRTSGDWSSNDAASSWKTDGLYSGVTDYRRLLGRLGDFTDEQLLEAQTTFKNAGYTFDLDPTTGYYKLGLLKNKNQEESPVLDSPGEDTPQEEKQDSGGTTQTVINPVTGRSPGGKGNGFWRTLSDFTPDLLGVGRLALSLNTNNRVAKTIRPSLTPVLKDTYERYSPVTGAFSEMQLRNKQGAATLSQAYKPFTSDASLASARMLEGQRHSNELQHQGFLADDKEIKRTQEQALLRQEDNMARRSEVANFNRASINQTNREKAQLEATRLKSNWQSWDNYLQGVEGRVRNKLQEQQLAKTSAMADALGAQYSEAVSKLDQLYKESNPTATTSAMLQDPNYVNAVKALRRQYQYDSYNFNLGNRKNPYSDYTPRSYEDILNSYKPSAKHGGQLNPSAAYLINKVIRNENNT